MRNSIPFNKYFIENSLKYKTNIFETHTNSAENR